VIQSRTIIREGHLTYMGKTNAFIVLVGKPEVNRSLERTRCGGEDNINMVVKEEIWTKRSGLIWLKIGTNVSFF
jgi:hypothetical protein